MTRAATARSAPGVYADGMVYETGAYFLDHDAWSYALIARVFAGEAAGLTRDDVLDNITIAWLTDTAISGARLYWENKYPYFSVKGVSIPVAVSAFPDELYQCPRSWAEKA